MAFLKKVNGIVQNETSWIKLEDGSRVGGDNGENTIQQKISLVFTM
jgi:hypothetical protein